MLRGLYFEGLPQDEAITLVSEYVDNLPSTYSSRLADSKGDICRVISSDAEKIWNNNGGQADVAKSSRTWEKVIARWRQTGFFLSDQATWSSPPQEKAQTVVDCEEVSFTEAEGNLVITQMAPVLVGRKQAGETAEARGSYPCRQVLPPLR